MPDGLAQMVHLVQMRSERHKGRGRRSRRANHVWRLCSKETDRSIRLVLVPVGLNAEGPVLQELKILLQPAQNFL